MATIDKADQRHEHLRTMLTERRREIMEKLRSIREAVPATGINEVTDVEEQSVNDFVQDIDFALMQMKAESLQRIDEALARLEAGHYGTCAECEEPISEARLNALPFATLCIGCQAEQEKNDAGDRRVGRATFDDREVGLS